MKVLSCVMFLLGIVLLVTAYVLKGDIEWINTYIVCAFWGLILTLIGPIPLIDGDTK